MNQAGPDQAYPIRRPAVAPSPGTMAGLIVVGSPLLGALLFRTYGYEVTPLAWEMVRHFSIFYSVCELVVVWLALRSGLDLTGFWGRLGSWDKTALTLWLATFWIGSLLSQQPVYSLVAVLSWPIHLLFALSVWHLASRRCLSTEESAGLIGAGIAVVVSGLLLAIAVHFAQAPDPAMLANGKVFWAGAIPGFLSVRLFGVVAAYAGLFGAGLLLSGQDRGRRRVAAVLVVLGFAALCWSSTRAAVPAFFAALLLVPLVMRCRPRGRDWAIVVGCLAMAAGLSALAPAPDASFGLLRTIGVQAPGGAGDITSERSDIWRVAIDAIAQRPIIGHGEGSTRWLVEQKTGGHVQPHNILLQLFLHWGAVAACAALWLAGRAIAAMLASVRRDPALLPFAMIVVAAPIAALFDGALYYPQMVMFPVAALAFALAPGQAKTTSRATG